MSTPTLSPTSYLVLGSLAVMGPATPYDLKQAVSAGIGHFWDFPHSQLYSEPQRLAEVGLVVEEREDGGRRRRVVSITAAGRTELRRWLATPTSDLPEIRDIALLKLFFGALARPGDLVALAEEQAAAHRERRAFYESLLRELPPAPATSTVRLGLAYEKAAAAFWASIATDPPPA